ncbi:diacylglycerol/lipid kinase family protein [Bacillus sp. USDA818B3_A]|uniref:diacylglycerol/lipid kinase family protein n=1 Tax=Bacillus sp. USDA818B3_A TaxID=2698834 RepID=UPI00136C985F|nr:diacylglycerol kinase family protein [Bacillus sp. USDA818B3_A]
MKQVYFIINPKARNGYCLNIWMKVEEVLVREGIYYLTFFTEFSGHAKKLAQQIAEQNEQEKLIVAVGGDGTIHEVLNGIAGYQNITLGFIPGGSGNDFSRGFQIPSDPKKALEFILRFQKRAGMQIDIGKILLNNHEEHLFLNNMGAGFDAIISYEVNQSRIKAMFNKLSLGRLIYVFFLLKNVFTYKTATFDLSIDGKTHIFEQTWFVTVSNQPFYGGGMKIAPEAKPDDGLLDITVVHQLSRLKLILVFISVFWGKHVFFTEVKTYRGKNITIQSPAKQYVHADGEHIGFTPLSIHLQAKALEVLSRSRGKVEVELEERDSNEFC